MQELFETAKKFQLETAAEVALFDKRMRFNYRIVLLLFISVNTAHASAELKAIFSPEMLFPFPAWYPHSWIDGNVSRWLSYAHNSLSHLMGSNIVSAIDGYPTSLLIVVSVQMEILGARLAALGHDRNHSGCDYERIKECIGIHQQILELSIWSMKTFTTNINEIFCVQIHESNREKLHDAIFGGNLCERNGFLLSHSWSSNCK